MAVPARRQDIDGLRGLAILAVLLYHLFPGALPLGYLGVDVFFVLSGYLITGLIDSRLASGTFRLRDFYAARARRLLPALLLMLTVVLLLGCLTLLPEQLASLGRYLSGSALFTTNLIALRELGYFDHAADTKPLLHLWSLGVEEQFYLCFPWLVLGLRRWPGALRGAVPVLLLGSLLACVRLTAQHVDAAFYLPGTRAWELLLGAAAVLSETAVRPAPRLDGMGAARHFLSRRQELLALLALTLLLATFLLPLAPGLASLPAALLAGLATALLLAGTRTSRINRRVLALAPLRGLGRISYSVYLWHWPLLVFALLHWGGALGTAMRLVIAALSLLAGLLSERWIERPVLAANSARRAPLWLLAGLLLLGTLGYLSTALDGLPQRYPKDIRFLVERPHFHHGEATRFGRCHIEIFATLAIQPECYSRVLPTLALMGDSHAAALYPGLRALQGEETFGLTQITYGYCPFYFFGPDAPAGTCRDRNTATLRRLQQNPPAVLVLTAAYTSPAYRFVSLERTLQLVAGVLRWCHVQLPDTRLVVVGPVPTWEGSPQQQQYLWWRQHGDLPHYLPAKMNPLFDQGLGRTVQAAEATYLSLYQLLCQPVGCLARTADEASAFTAIDEGHLSPTASRWVVQSRQTAFLSKTK